MTTPEVSYTLAECEPFLKCSAQTLARRIERGEVQAYDLTPAGSRRTWRITASEIARLQTPKQVRPAPTPRIPRKAPPSTTMAAAPVVDYDTILRARGVL